MFNRSSSSDVAVPIPAVKALAKISSIEQIPSFSKPADDLPRNFDENEVFVVYLTRHNKHLILATPEGMAQTSSFFEFVNKLRNRGEVEIARVDSSLIFSVKSRLESMDSDSGLEKKEKTRARDLFVQIIDKGIEVGASDVHVCVREDTGRVLYRIDGAIRRWNQFASKALREAMGVGFTLDAQEKTRSDNAFLADFAQKCMIPYEHEDGRKFNLRYQSEVTIGGFDVVIRYLKNNLDVKVLQLEELGYEESQRRQLAYAATKSIGCTIISGITGSGKTTTLNTILQTLPNRDEKKIYAYEDPTEIRMRGVSQVSVPPKDKNKPKDDEADSPFLENMKNFLRLDPDVGMFGEIRDRATALILQQAAESGHQIFTTIHATSALGTVKRLLSPQIGLTRDVLGADDFFTALVYQKLIQKVCPHCNVPAIGTLSDSKLALLEVKFNLDVNKLRCASVKGCPHCRISGFQESSNGENDQDVLLGVKGQTVIAEIIVPDDQMREYITNGEDLKAKRYWRSLRKAGYDDPNMDGKTAFEHGLYKVSQGLVDLRTLESSFVPIEFYQVHDPAEMSTGGKL
ncbi:hypothetical protein CL689_04890 [Candidatus Saccharibacteria bacterium]|nr:hypothetical protein [Candidatus Saccharibacteria bacterium]